MVSAFRQPVSLARLKGSDTLKTHTKSQMKLNRISGYTPPVTVAIEDGDEFPETTILESKTEEHNILLMIMTEPALQGHKESEIRKISETRRARVRFLQLRLELLTIIATTGEKSLPDEKQEEYENLVIQLERTRSENPWAWAQSAPSASTGFQTRFIGNESDLLKEMELSVSAQ